MKITHQIGDRVKVLHNIPLGNLIGTIKAIHARPKHDVYEVELDGGGTDQLYAEQLEKITDTPETDAIHYAQVERDNTSVTAEYFAMKEHAETMERERDAARERLKKLSNAASVLWEEHKAFGEEVHDTEGVDFLGSDSEGHAMMQALVDETLSSISCQNA